MLKELRRKEGKKRNLPPFVIFQDPSLEEMATQYPITQEWLFVKKFVEAVSNKFPNVPVVLGGEHVTAMPEKILDTCPGVDICVLGEGEETIVDLAQCFPEKLSEVQGIVYRDEQGKIRWTEPRKRIRDIEKIPRPDWDELPIDAYLTSQFGHGLNAGRTMPILATRGCPFQCTFCSSPFMWGTRWVARDTKLLADEIEEYIEKYNITNVDFYDLTAIVKKSWIIEFCNELISRNLNISWQLPSGTRSEAIDDDVTPLLYKSGCRNMNYAPESGSERMLLSIKKKVKLYKMLQSLKSAVKSKINVKINIIIGFPNETHKDIWMTLFYLIKFSMAGAHDVSVGVFAPYPGSELYNDLVSKGKIDHNEEYWQKLAYVDISETKSYCDNMSSKTLLFYNWLAISVFYCSNYLFRPIRVINTIKNLLTNKHESRGEMALAQILKRLNFLFGLKKKTN